MRGKQKIKVQAKSKTQKAKSKTQKVRSPRRFDPVLKNIFSNSVKAILSLIGLKAEKILPLPAEIHITKTLRPDLLFDTPKFIIQIEIQNFPDPLLPLRMLIYYVLIYLWQEKEVKAGRRKRIKPIIQVVVWAGKGKPPPSLYKTEYTTHRYFIIDMRAVSPSVFLKSKNPYEVILALITGGKPQNIFPEVIQRLQEIIKSQDKLLKFIEEVEIFAELFGFRFDWEMIRAKIDIRKTSLFKIGKKEGRKEGRREGEIIGERKGLQEAILLDIEVKFGKDKAQIIKPKIQKIQDIKKLKSLKIKVTKAGSWEEFLKSLNSNLYKSSSSNSKMKDNKR